MCDCDKCTKEREHKKFMSDLHDRIGANDKWREEYGRECAKQARDGRLFCKKCLISDHFFKGGGSWGIDCCPKCGGYECITYGNMSFLKKYKAEKLFKEMWDEEWGIKRSQ